MTGSLALAIDLGGTKVEAALVDADGHVIATSRHRAATGPLAGSDELAAAVISVLTGSLAAVGGDDALLGIGIGCAGPITVDRGEVSPLNLPVWRDYPLRALVANHLTAAGFAIPVTLRMDGLCIALAEHWVGATRGFDNAMGMIVSTGIGGGLILKGLTVAGPTGNAGHVGHIEVAGHDEPCACGGRGCVEAVASGPNSVRWAQGKGWAGSTGEDLASGYAAGDPIAVAAVARSGRAIGNAIASATSLVDLEVVAIGGGFSRVTPDLFGYIREPIAERRQFGFVTKVQVVPSALDSDGPLVGAAALVHRAELIG